MINFDPYPSYQKAQEQVILALQEQLAAAARINAELASKYRQLHDLSKRIDDELLTVRQRLADAEARAAKAEHRADETRKSLAKWKQSALEAFKRRKAERPEGVMWVSEFVKALGYRDGDLVSLPAAVARARNLRGELEQYQEMWKAEFNRANEEGEWRDRRSAQLSAARRWAEQWKKAAKDYRFLYKSRRSR